MESICVKAPEAVSEAVYELDPLDFDDARELFCYIKPIGPGLKILRKQDNAERVALHISGTENCSN